MPAPRARICAVARWSVVGFAQFIRARLAIS
jgi:hypothetical protein